MALILAKNGQRPAQTLIFAQSSKKVEMRGKIDETITVATYLTCTLVLTRGRFFYILNLRFCVLERAILGKIEGFETVFSRAIVC